jgi:hypothetical protein
MSFDAQLRYAPNEDVAASGFEGEYVRIAGVRFRSRPRPPAPNAFPAPQAAIAQPYALMLESLDDLDDPPEVARKTLEESVFALQKLPEGWDGYSGVAPSRNATLDGVAFIHHMPAAWPDPLLSVGGGGGFSFYWRRNDAVVDIEFDGTGTASVYIARDDEVLLSEVIPITGEAISGQLLPRARPLLDG